MSDNNLPVPHRLQKEDGYCLPACVEMVLAYIGIYQSQEKIGKKLGLRPRLGVPGFKIKELDSRQLITTYAEGTLSEIALSLQKQVPVIALVQAGELPHWLGVQSQHAVVVVGIQEQNMAILDPAVETHPIGVPIGDFMLAWLEMDNRYATIQLRR